MIKIEPFELLSSVVGIAATGLLFLIPVWLCVRFRWWGALLSIPCIWGLLIASFWADRTVDAQADTNFTEALWVIFGLLPSTVFAAIIFGLTTAVTAIIRRRWPLSVEKHRSLLRRIECIGMPFMLGALLLLGGLAAIGKGAGTGPTFKSTGI